MSVPKSRRGLSHMEFYHNAITLRKEITLLLLRDFGIKDKIRKATVITENMSEEDATKVIEILDKYDCSSILYKYPDWIINTERDNILKICHRLIMNITQANSIYPTNIAEYQSRRLFQDYAIGNCEQLLQEMQYVMSIIPVNSNKYMRYVDMIETEIILLKGWRKSDNKILKNLTK